MTRPRSNARALELDADAWSPDTGELSFDLLADATVVHKDGPLVVCLACGGDPSVRDDCPHDEFARFATASSELQSAAEDLRGLSVERAQQERTLRKLTALAAAVGEAEVIRREQPEAFVRAPVTATISPPRKGIRKRRASSDAQGSFVFAADEKG